MHGSATRRRILKGTVGAATAVASVGFLSGAAAAHFPTQLDIDVRPETDDPYIDVGEHETVSVTVFPVEYLNGDGERERFDPTEEPVRYRFGSRFALEDGEGARPIDGGEPTTVETEDGERRDALRLEFPVDETGLEGGEEAVWLFWERDEDGNHGLSGTEAIRVFPSIPADDGLVELIRRLVCRPGFRR